MKIDRKEISDSIAETIADGVVWGEEVDVTTQAIMDKIWPLIRYLKDNQK